MNIFNILENLSSDKPVWTEKFEFWNLFIYLFILICNLKDWNMQFWKLFCWKYVLIVKEF